MGVSTHRGPECSPKNARALFIRTTTTPKGPYTAHLRTLVPKTIPSMVFGTRVLKWAVYGPFGKTKKGCISYGNLHIGLVSRKSAPRLRFGARHLLEDDWAKSGQEEEEAGLGLCGIDLTLGS